MELWPAGDALPSAGSLVATAQERPNGDQLGRALAALAVETVKSGGEPIEDYAERQFFRLEEFAFKRQADAIRVKLQKVNPVSAPGAYQPMFDEWLELVTASRRAREKAEAVGSASA